MRALVDFVLFQVGWFACVLGGAAGYGWIGPVSAAILIAAHIWGSTPREWRRTEIGNVALFGAIGTALDCLQVQLGILDFGLNGDDGAPLLSTGLFGLPAWMAALWFLFPIMFNTTLVWLRPYTLLATAFGLIGGPLAYVGGEGLGALTLGGERWIALGSVGVVWGVFTPAALRWCRRWQQP